MNLNKAMIIGNITRDRGINEMVKAIGLVQKKKPVRFIIGGTFATKSLEDKFLDSSR